ncbi:MAG: type II secretion system protein [Bacilli bacterium]
MKNNSGFTLIEMISIMVILSIITLIAVPTVISIVENAKNNLYNQQASVIVMGAKKWGIDNIDLLPIDSDCIALKSLQTLGYVEKDIVNPKTKKIMGGSVKIENCKDFKQYKYTYQEVDCVVK